MGSVLPELRDIPQCVRPNTSNYMFTFSLLFCTLLPNCLLVHIRGTKSQPDEQLMLDPTSAILGGKLRFDAYNNGGEWLNSVHDVGNSLVRYGNMKKSHCKPQISFHRWGLCMPRTIIGTEGASRRKEARRSSLCLSVSWKWMIICGLSSQKNKCLMDIEQLFDKFM